MQVNATSRMLTSTWNSNNLSFISRCSTSKNIKFPIQHSWARSSSFCVWVKLKIEPAEIWFASTVIFDKFRIVTCFMRAQGENRKLSRYSTIEILTGTSSKTLVLEKRLYLLLKFFDPQNFKRNIIFHIIFRIFNSRRVKSSYSPRRDSFRDHYQRHFDTLFCIHYWIYNLISTAQACQQLEISNHHNFHYYEWSE